MSAYVQITVTQVSTLSNQILGTHIKIYADFSPIALALALALEPCIIHGLYPLKINDHVPMGSLVPMTPPSNKGKGQLMVS